MICHRIAPALLGAGLLALAGCEANNLTANQPEAFFHSGNPLGQSYSLKRLAKAEPSGSAFNRTLAVEYRAFATEEANVELDHFDADFFARKGLQAATNETTAPESPELWRLREADLQQLSSARGELVALLDAGAREKAATDAAIAQARYDCWVEEQEEGWQEDHIAACRDQFWAAMERIRAAMAPKPQAQAVEAPPPPEQPAPEIQRSYIVFFDWDSAEVTAEALAVIGRAASTAKEFRVTRISAVGHTDLSGPDSYNLKLSDRRATAVRDALADDGVGLGFIESVGLGEAEPLVQTPDGVREAQNRRVEIRLEE